MKHHAMVGDAVEPAPDTAAQFEPERPDIRRMPNVRRGLGAAGIGSAMCALAVAGVMAAGIPASAQADGDSDSEPVVGFQANSTGLYPDTTWNENYLNAGNRGCNSCHTDLNDVMDAAHAGLEYDHPITRVGFSNSYNATILDGCLSCHDIHSSDYGNYFADAIHTRHYSSQAFTDTFAGNCWSCHVITDSSSLTELGTWDIKLWEEVKYDGALGGYPDTTTNPLTQEFLKFRGLETGTATGVQVPTTEEVSEEDSDEAQEQEQGGIAVSMHQDVITDLTDAFTALNHSGKYDEDDMYDTSHTVTLTGVKNPRTFTYDELCAMPQTEVTATNQCVVAGSAGHNIYNATYTGVTLQYLVELCGGLEDGVNQVYVTGWDEWENCALQQRLGNYYDNGLIALKINGEDVPYELGGPMLLVAPGTGGAFWTKFVKSIDFNEGEEPYDFVESYADSIPGDELNYVSAAWFQNDGLNFELGQPVQLSGYAYALATSVAPLTAIEFSTDLGTTWQRIDVPEGFDPLQWVQFDFSWTPEAAGTYIVKVRGVNANGSVNETDGSVIVTVSDSGTDDADSDADAAATSTTDEQ